MHRFISTFFTIKMEVELTAGISSRRVMFRQGREEEGTRDAIHQILHSHTHRPINEGPTQAEKGGGEPATGLEGVSQTQTCTHNLIIFIIPVTLNGQYRTPRSPEVTESSIKTPRDAKTCNTDVSCYAQVIRMQLSKSY